MLITSSELKSALLGLALIVAPATQAGTLICTGTAAEVSLHLPNQLLVRLSSMNDRVLVCLLDATHTVAGQLSGSTTATTCKGMYASLLAAKASGQPMQMVMDANVLPSACDTFAPWTPVSLRLLVNQ